MQKILILIIVVVISNIGFTNCNCNFGATVDNNKNNNGNQNNDNNRKQTTEYLDLIYLVDRFNLQIDKEYAKKVINFSKREIDFELKKEKPGYKGPERMLYTEEEREIVSDVFKNHSLIDDDKDIHYTKKLYHMTGYIMLRVLDNRGNLMSHYKQELKDYSNVKNKELMEYDRIACEELLKNGDDQKSKMKAIRDSFPASYENSLLNDFPFLQATDKDLIRKMINSYRISLYGGKNNIKMAAWGIDYDIEDEISNSLNQHGPHPDPNHKINSLTKWIIEYSENKQLDETSDFTLDIIREKLRDLAQTSSSVNQTDIANIIQKLKDYNP